jgi:hypothetical protein
MSFTVDCTCGRTLQVTAAQAGGDVRCDCGAVQAVPALSELRHRAGQSRYRRDIAETIRYLVAEGRLPADDKCMGCGIVTDDVLQLVVECALPKQKSPGIWDVIILKALVPIGHLLGDAGRSALETEVVGREIVVKTPLRLCGQCADTTPLSRRDDLVCLLENVPLYRQLLNKYPCARITTSW